MENKVNVPNHESMPTYSQKNKETHESSFKSSLTHPSVKARNMDDLFKRIRSGNDVLCRLPTRLDPSVEFSEDEDDDEPVEGSGNENKEPEGEKTPEFRPRTHELTSRFAHCPTSSRKSLVAPPSFNPFNQKYFSAQKPPNTARNRLSMHNFMPQSEYKIRKSTALAENQPKIRMDLMSPPKFRVPFDKPLASNIFVKKASPLTDDIILVNEKSYSVLSLLGSGGSCKVYSVFDLEKKSLVAVKCVDLKNTDPSIREGYKKEIEYLQKLQHSNRVIKMFDYEYRKDELFIVLERGEVDFAKYISNEAKLKRLSPLMIKFYWVQMLEAVADIHKYGIVHSDLKPANFLLVSGNLKLIDFGIATSVPDDKTSTFRDTQVGTLNYMSPEAITQMSDSEKVRFKIGVKSDVWSLGCILYNLVYGVTPFHSFKNLMQKINAITNPNYEIEFRPLADKWLVDVLKKCLKRNPKERASVEELLNHPYLKEDNKKSNHLNTVMEQMQVLTPNSLKYVSKMVKELSEKN